VYSLAILLEEERIYDRCVIYATDVNLHALEEARGGIFPLARLREYTANYFAAGGTRPFSEYYTAGYDHAIFQGALRRNVVFSRHDLAVDGPFHRFHVILCRNVLIYFNEALTTRIHRLFYESLQVPGFLGLGSRESLRLTPHEACYEETESSKSLYRKVR
jgi:chemotaxis protein methyltransferase CheR